MLRYLMRPSALGLRAYSAGKRPFDKILVANRGEISCRVMRTAKKLGIKTVAIYSEPDANALHVRMADEAVCVGPAASSKSYLNIDAVVDAVKKTGAEAVHPGYGFLSENRRFAERLDKEGVVFIGPNTHSIEAMGDKIESKKLAINAKVNTIPGFVGTVDTKEDVLRIAREIGYPVMIKASAGGGGKGMRVAYNDKEALDGYRLSKEEARNSFGDDRIFIEKFIEDPRHIEIQVLGDKHGNYVAFPERECSIQRRNQKVIEESPSMLLDTKTRLAMGEQAIQLARAVGYHSAGTVEFLCDPQKNFYFLEMNTRLQVEHAITEEVTGEDLVEHMLWVAAGKPLPSRMLGKPLPIKGWSFECRVYAEDPHRGFLPSIGKLLQYQPPSGPGVRVDAGVLEGSEISMHYDPMISKLITHGKTREEARIRMNKALDQYVIRGLEHNVPFMRDVLRHQRFIDGRISTKFIAEEYPEGFQGITLSQQERNDLVATAAILHMQREFAEASMDNQLESAEPSMDNELVVQVSKDSAPLRVALVPEVADVEEDEEGEAALEGSVQVRIREEGSDEVQDVLQVSLPDFNPVVPLIQANVGEREVNIQLMGRVPEGFVLQHCGGKFEVLVRTPRQHELARHMIPKPELDTSKMILSPMPGSLVSVAVKPGDHVEAGQELCVVEAMKMQNVLRATKAGQVKSVAAAAGSTLSVDQLIVELE